MFIYMQKTNFISPFVLEMLQRYHKIAIIDTLDIFMQKIIFISPIFLEILQRYYKHVIWGTLGMNGHVHQKQ